MSLDGNVSVDGFEEDDKSDIGGGELQGSITIIPSNEQQVLQGGNGERYIIEGNGTETTGRIVIEGGDAEVTLKNVNIKAAIVDIYGEAIEVTKGTVTFILEGENWLKAGYGAAIYNAEGSTIVLKGDGKLIATGIEQGAGIGGSRDNRGFAMSARNAGVIRILSGTIEATGNLGTPGIGAGYGNCQGVEISGGTVKATAGSGRTAHSTSTVHPSLPTPPTPTSATLIQTPPPFAPPSTKPK